MSSAVNSSIANIGQAAGWIMVLSSIVQLPGLFMFWFRQGHKGGAPRSPARYRWERSFIAAWVIMTAVGFVLLAAMFQNRPGQALALTGVAAYCLGSVLLAAAEILSPTTGYEKVYPLAAGYVVIAFLAQAVTGAALLQSGLTTAWAGLASIIWNIAGLVIIPRISPRDIYFPVLHSVAPLLIGIALFLK